MSIGPVLFARRKKLLEHLKNIQANSIETAKTIDEILPGWEFGFVKILRRHALMVDLRFLAARKKLAKTNDGKYYLLTKPKD